MKDQKNELQNILSAKSQNSSGNNIRAIINYLAGSQTASTSFEEKQSIKEQEEKQLIKFIDSYKLFNNDIPYFIDTVFYLNSKLKS